MFDKIKQAERSQNKMQYIPLHWRCMIKRIFNAVKWDIGIIQSRFGDIHKLDWIIPDVPFYLIEYLFSVKPC